ncbi:MULTISPECIES: SAM-dependent methyltransferase [unclassified Streptomyces]|uniref:SAM-dependent methyltransferase n=1 Tax=unclassified Streptomyces TaxID=2593676 RepID=UPI000CD5894E|nr:MULTISPECIES: SAM-dependent methyltransferase [unclassified Streptomyces]
MSDNPHRAPGSTTPAPAPETDLQPDKPHSARVWNYWLGGRDNFPADQKLGDLVAAGYPQIPELARASRAFQRRAVRHLAADAGVRQFLDVGTGLPAVDSTHEVAQSAAPGSRVVYVDNDPLVLTHARALLTSAPGGTTDYVHADLTDHAAVLEAASRTLDLSQPVALLLLSTLGHITAEAAAELVPAYTRRLAPGSHLVLCDTLATPQTLRAQEAYAEGDTEPYLVRQPDEITACAAGMELLEPGFVPIDRWRPDGSDGVPVDQWGFVAVRR